MRFGDAIRLGWNIIRIEREAYRAAAASPESFTWALVITAIAGFSAGLGPHMAGVGAFIWYPFVRLLWLFVVAGIFHVLALLLGGRGDYMGFLRIVGLAELLGWPAVIPFVGGIVHLWMLVVIYIALREHQGLDTTKALVVLLFPVILFALLALIAGAFFGAALLGGAIMGV